MASVAVEVAGVSKLFGGKPVLDKVNLRAAAGDTVAILGPSGCGKTTLLRILAGLESPDQGTVTFDGQDVTRIPARDRGIGMVFQNYALYPHMDAQRILGFFFTVRQREPEIEARIPHVCEIMGADFAGLLKRRPNQLSGGQQQRVAIGRCIIRDPRVFLFDEPLSSLDAKLRAQTRVEIRRLLRRFQITSFYVTHDQSEASAICDRLAVMRHGRIEQTGTFREVYDRPASTFVAGFVGTPPMNLLEGELAPDGWRLPGMNALLPLPAHVQAHLAALPGVMGSQITLGIRPEALRLAGDTEDGWEASVVLSEPLIAERQQQVTGTLHTLGEPQTATRGPRAGGPEIIARLPGQPPLSRDQPVRLTCDVAAIHVFNVAGRRMG